MVAGAAGAAPSAGAPQEGSSFWQPQDGAVEEPQLEHESQLEHEPQLEAQQQCWNQWHKLKPQPPQPPHALACDCKQPTERQIAATTTIIRFIKARFMKSPSKQCTGNAIHDCNADAASLLPIIARQVEPPCGNGSV